MQVLCDLRVLFLIFNCQTPVEKAAMEESPDIKEKVADMISTYHIRPEDKKRDSEAFQELVSLGRISHEGPIVDEKHSGI